MKTLLNIITQYHDENGKPKGGNDFHVYVNSDTFMYTDQEAIEVIKQMLADYSKEWAGNYTYIDHDLVFFEPINLDQDKFDKLYEQKLEQVYGKLKI